MSGLLWKTLRRESFVVRWPSWAWLWFRRGGLRVKWWLRSVGRWFGQDVGRWFTEGWGANWIRWRWAGVAAVCTFVGLVLYELVRPFKVIATELFGEYERRDRKWVLPSLAGIAGLLLMILLFLSGTGRALNSGTILSIDRHAADDSVAVALVPRIEPRAELRDPFDDGPVLDVPAFDEEPIARFDPDREPFDPPEPEPEPVVLEVPIPEPFPETDIPPEPEPEPEPFVERFQPEPFEPEPLPEPADLDVAVSRGPTSDRWQPRLADESDVHFLGVGLLPAGGPGPDFDADGWERYLPPMRDAGLMPVVQTVHEYAEATASSTLVRDEVEPEPAPAPAPAPAPVVPVTPTVADPPERRIEFVAFMDETTRVGDRCAVEFRAINTGDVAVEDLVVRIDLPEQFDHHLGRFVDYSVGRLAPGERRSARLVVDSVAPGQGSVVVRLEGPDLAEVEHRRFVVAREEPTASPNAEPRPAPRTEKKTPTPVRSPPLICPPIPCVPYRPL